MIKPDLETRSTAPYRDRHPPATLPPMPISRSPILRFLLPLGLALLGAAMCAYLVPAENLAVRQQIANFPDSDFPAHLARPIVLGGLCFLPTLASLIYCLGSTLDRYMAREFARTFGICLSALLVIWLLIDLSDNITEFRESKQIVKTIGQFYLTRSPAIILLLLPYSLLLSLLYALGKLSGNREIIAMIQSGRGLFRITRPLIHVGLLLSLLCLGLNYHWAPIAEGSVGNILSAASGKKVTAATNVLYNNPGNRRLWMVGAFPQNYHVGEPLLNVEVTTSRGDKSLESRLSAAKAFWSRKTREWSFEKAIVGTYREGEPVKFEVSEVPLTINGWTETPWQLIKPGLSAAYLGIPELNSWLKENSKNSEFASPAPYLTQWHYRWALPFTCLVSVLLATPLAVQFSRRGNGSGIFMAVILSALMLLLSNISLALGEAGSMRPALAAWLPNGVFSLVGLYLFYRRSSGGQIFAHLRRIFPGNDNG